jgi:hypothetical protein
MERPIFLTDEHLGILENLDQTALYNMFFAVPYILQCFPKLTPKQAQETLLYQLHKTESCEKQELVYVQ